MKNILIGASLAILAAGSAYAVEGGASRPTADADGNGVLTRAEAQAFATQTFAKLDANKDGKLDQADREARRAAMFDRLDTDRNGQLSRAEFTARPARAERGPRPEGEKGFGRGGRHGHYGMRGGMMMRGPGGAFGADTDKDGAISQAEFTAAAMKRFDAADANKDGQVTKEEREAQRAQKRQKWQNRGQPSAPPAN